MTKKPQVPQKKTKVEKLLEFKEKSEFRKTADDDDIAAYIDVSTGELELNTVCLSPTDALRLRDFITEWFE